MFTVKAKHLGILYFWHFEFPYFQTFQKVKAYIYISILVEKNEKEKKSVCIFKAISFPDLHQKSESSKKDFFPFE